MLPDNKTKEIVIANNLIEEPALNEHIEKATAANKPLESFLIDENIITEDIFYTAVASFYDVPFVNLKEKHISQDVLLLIPEPIAVNYEIIPFEKDETGISVALSDPEDAQTIEFIKRKVNMPVRLYIATPSSIRETAQFYHKNLQTELAAVHDAKKTENAKKGAGLEDLAKDVPIIRVIDTLLEYAIFEGASDIHIEPVDASVIVRYRVDGILREAMKLPKNMQDGLIARIKVLSNLKLDEHRQPQDGRFKIATPEYEISFRVSVLPVYNGEKAVLRLLNEKQKNISLKELGIRPDARAIIERAIKKPNGMILVTGPTGSGKTTTLYTMMDLLNSEKVNISTVEDPIEYHMPRINQSQVNAKIGFTFANGLRALLRQDPDIIMVGEIRDNETAGIAINAAMTGHLVLTTLHTNDAAGAIPRMRDMGVEQFLINSTLELVVAQRLVRKICKHCIASYSLTNKEIDDLAKKYGLDMERLSSVFVTEEETTKDATDFSNFLFFRGKGCNKCGGQGFRGRIGIYEFLEATEEIRGCIIDHADAATILKTAKKAGMITMLEDGFLKAKQGITSIEEVLRVTVES